MRDGVGGLEIGRICQGDVGNRLIMPVGRFLKEEWLRFDSMNLLRQLLGQFLM